MDDLTDAESALVNAQNDIQKLYDADSGLGSYLNTINEEVSKALRIVREVRDGWANTDKDR